MNAPNGTSDRRPAILMLLMLGLSVLAPTLAEAQQQVTAVWQPAGPADVSWTVGDPISIRLDVGHMRRTVITIPELPAAWGPFEVEEQISLGPAEDENGATTASLQVRVRLWSPGEFQTPPLVIHYEDHDGRSHEVLAEPLTVTIESVLSETDVEKRDLKPQASLPKPPVWPWVVAGLLAATALFLAARWLRKRMRLRRGEEPIACEPVDDRPPEQIAYEELERVAALDLPAKGQLKRHYTLVSDCVRVYLEGIWGVPATDRTSSEVIAELRRLRVNGEASDRLIRLLNEADLVKFAKLLVSVDTARGIVDEAHRFVDITKPDRNAVQDEGPQDQGTDV